MRLQWLSLAVLVSALVPPAASAALSTGWRRTGSGGSAVLQDALVMQIRRKHLSYLYH